MITGLAKTTIVGIAIILMHAAMVDESSARGRVPTNYNQRYQALFAEQELFRKRPELLGCVYAARDYIDASNDATFNKLRYQANNVEAGFVIEAGPLEKITRTVRISGEGRVRAYSFLENWEAAEVQCTFVSGEQPLVRLNLLGDPATK
jgi:hypothetical protein